MTTQPPIWQLDHLQAPYAGQRHHRIERAPIQLARTLDLAFGTSPRPGEVDAVGDRLGHG